MKRVAEYSTAVFFLFAQLPQLPLLMLSKTRTSKLQSSSSWKQMQSSWSLLRASPLEPRHTSQNTSHLVIYPWIYIFFFVDTSLLESILIYWSLVQFWFVFNAFASDLDFHKLCFRLIALLVRLWIVPPCRAIDPCRKPIPRCTTWWFRRLQSPVKSYDLWDVVFFRQKKHLFPRKTTYTYLRYELPRWDTALILLSNLYFVSVFPKYLKHPQATKLHLSISPRATGEESPDALHRAHCIRELHQPWSHGPLSALSHEETRRQTKKHETPWWVLRIWEVVLLHFEECLGSALTNKSLALSFYHRPSRNARWTESAVERTTACEKFCKVLRGSAWQSLLWWQWGHR